MSAEHASGLEAFLLHDDFDGEMFPNEPLLKHTTYRIGGPARYLVRVDSISALCGLLNRCKEENVSTTILGRGSNLLVSDKGYDGIVIVLGRDFKNIRFNAEENILTAGAGISLSAVVREAFRLSVSGLEFAVGTPGTLGGALIMNAGTSTDWIGSRVSSVAVLHEDNTLERLRGDDIEWGYRTSSFKPGDTIIECELKVTPSDSFTVGSKMRNAHDRRRTTQPQGVPSCGSVFRNPPGKYAAQLIEGAGLKGLAQGGARVSDVHANFIVNEKGATAQDILTLIAIIEQKVFEKYGVMLEREVRFLGFPQQ